MDCSDGAELVMELEVGPDAPGQARDGIRRLLRGRSPAKVDDVCLVVTELVSNSVRHVPWAAAIRFSACLQHSDVVLEVRDGGEVPHTLSPPSGQTGGFGLRIISSLAKHWGTLSGGGFWCEMALGSDN